VLRLRVKFREPRHLIVINPSKAEGQPPTWRAIRFIDSGKADDGWYQDEIGREPHETVLPDARAASSRRIIRPMWVSMSPSIPTAAVPTVRVLLCPADSLLSGLVPGLDFETSFLQGRRREYLGGGAVQAEIRLQDIALGITPTRYQALEKRLEVTGLGRGPS